MLSFLPAPLRAALAATLLVARRLTSGVVVTVFPDGAEKYFSESLWTADA